MPARFDPPSSSFDENRIIHFERNYGGAACRRQSDDVCAIVAPLKVLRPFLPPGIEEGRRLSSSGINCHCLGTFVTIAEIAGQPEILNRRTAASGD